MQEAAFKKGVMIEHRAKTFEDGFFTEFDYIIAVNQQIFSYLTSKASNKEEMSKIHLATEYCQSHKDQDIPDPFFNGGDGFDSVYAIISESADGLFKNLIESRS